MTGAPRTKPYSKTRMWLTFGPLAAGFLVFIVLVVTHSAEPDQARQLQNAQEQASAMASQEALQRAQEQASNDAAVVQKPHITAAPAAPAAQPATAQATQGNGGGHGVTLYFTADAGAPVNVTYSCAGANRSSCQAASGSTVSVTGVALQGGVGMQCRITVGGQTVTDKHVSVGAQGGALTCSAVIP